MRFAGPQIAVLLVLAGLLAGGCGGSSDEDSTESGAAHTSTAPAGAATIACSKPPSHISQLRATGVGCRQARKVAAGWLGEPSCPGPAAASRYSCRIEGFRCLSAAADRGVSVGCARPGHSIAFLARR